MIKKYSHQVITGVSFGLTSGVITSLGIIVGLYSATASKLAVISGIVIMAIADGLSDAAGVHISEESEIESGEAKHTHKEVWLATLITFLSVAGFTLTFVIPVLTLPLNVAIPVAVAWGLFLLTVLNFIIAKIKSDNPAKLIFEHVALAVFVIIVSKYAGVLIARWMV